MDLNITNIFHPHRPLDEEVRRDRLSKQIKLLEKEKYELDKLPAKCDAVRIRHHPEEISKLYDSSAFDIGYQKALQCVQNTIIYDDPSNIHLNLIKYYIKELEIFSKDIGDQVLIQHLNKSSSSPFMVKVDDYIELIHEAFLGIHIMNHLREMIPNFVYTYAFASLPNLYCEGESCVIGDETEKRIGYLFIERIPDSISLVEFIWTSPEKEINNIFLQIFMALEMAHERVEFTHYDLHASNVLIRKLSRPYQLSYVIRGVKYYIVTDNLAVIIDYGNSHAVKDGIHYGIYANHNGYDLGIDIESSYPFHDIFSLLIADIIKYPIGKQEILQTITDKISKENILYHAPQDGISVLRASSFHRARNIQHRDLVNIMLVTVPHDFKLVPEPVDFYNCLDGICLPKEHYLSRLSDQPVTFVELFEMIFFADKEDKERMRKFALERSEEAWYEFEETITGLSEKLHSRYKLFEENKTSDDLFETLGTFERTIDIYNEITFLVYIVKNILGGRLEKLAETEEYLRATKEELEKEFPFLDLLSERFKEQGEDFDREIMNTKNKLYR